jgi:divalent metal cation (Fe/Co/Zn/Cd) transporter
LVWACWLTALTITWNGLEAGVGIADGLRSGSVALVAFALDSVIEVGAGLVIAWRLTTPTADPESAERLERRATRLIAVSLFLIAAYVVVQSGLTLASLEREPGTSVIGLVLVALSLPMMRLLAWGKRRVATRLESTSINADASESELCSYLSAIVLLGLGANLLLGWWWLDPVAALAVAGIAAREGWRAWTTRDLCC